MFITNTPVQMASGLILPTFKWSPNQAPSKLDHSKHFLNLERILIGQ